MPTTAVRPGDRRSTPVACPRCDRLESRRLLSGGDLDPSFAGDGTATMDIPGSLHDVGLALAVQGDGKVVVASASDQHMAVTRYLPDGSLDTTFGTAGTAQFRFGNALEIPRDLAIDGLGRIVVAGWSGATPRGGDFAVARLTPAGALDTTFDGDGMVRVDFGGNDDIAVGLALRADNSILLAGTTQPRQPSNLPRSLALAALRENGTTDTSFGGGDGLVTTPVGSTGAAAGDVVVDTAGRIVVCGTATLSSTGPFLLARYLPDGTPDNSFDGDGQVTTAMTGGVLRGLALAPGGKIVAGGWSNNPFRGDEDMTAVRYNENGSLDTTFDGDGKALIDLATDGQHRYDRAYAVAVDPSDGGVFLAGTSSARDSMDAPTDTRSAIVRLTSAGALNTDFLTTGFELARPNQFNALAITPAGAIFAAGEAPDGGPFGTEDILLVKYGRGGRDITFGNGDLVLGTAGTVTTNLHGPVANRGNAAAVQSDGKVVVAGETESGNDRITDFGLARFNADGTPDTTFGGTGYVANDFSHHQDWLNALAVQGDGKIVAAGYNSGGDGNEDVLVVRYLPDGSLDPSFGGGAGKVSVADVGGVPVFGTAMALQRDGKIVVAGGFGGVAGTDRMLVLRFNADGTPDTSFGGGDGAAVIPAGAGDYLFARGVAVDGAGRIVAVGGQSGVVAVVRLDPAGNPDPSFDGDGVVRTRFSDTPGSYGFPFALGVDGANRVVVAGPTREGSSLDDDFGVIRFLEDGSLDPAFGTGGRVVTDFKGGQDQAKALAITPGGSIVVAGMGRVGTGGPFDFEMAMYTPAGVLDSSFGQGGKVTTDFAPGSPDEATALALDGADRVVAAGTAGGDFAAARYLLSPAAAPRVRQASVSGSAWNAPFRDHLRDAGLSLNPSGYAVGSTAGEPLPWVNLNQVSVTFDQQVQVGANDLRVRRVDGTEYALDPAAFSYDPATRTATWRLANGAVFGADRVRADLDGDAVRGGGRTLNGGDLVARFDVLPGDANRSGVVLADDFSAVKRKFFGSTTNPLTGAAAYSVFHDVNGSGTILADDFSQVKAHFFQTLPAAAPAAPPPPRLTARRIAEQVL